MKHKELFGWSTAVVPDKTNDNTMLSSSYALERLLSMLQTVASASVANYDNQSVQTVTLQNFPWS